MKQRTTIHDIAKALNTTAATVSRALNDHPAISDATKVAVRSMASELNYQQNKLASALRSGKSNVLGVMIPSAEINFFGSVVHGIQQIANLHNYSIIIYQSNELAAYEQKGMEAFLRSRADGVIASVAKETINWDHYREVKARGVPLILFDRDVDELQVPSVVVNDYKGALMATRHLIQQGCKRIAHISGPLHLRIFNERLKGYLDALKENGMEPDEEMIVSGKVSIESGRNAMELLWGRAVPPDGVFAVEDFTGLGVLQYLKSIQVKVPEQVAVIGFANEGFSQYITPSLSTIDQQTKLMGEESAKLFFELNATGDFYEKKPRKKILEPTLVIRESSVRIKKQHKT